MKKIAFGNKNEFELEAQSLEEFILRKSGVQSVGISDVGPALNAPSTREALQKLSPLSLRVNRLILRVRLGGDPSLNAAVVGKIAACKIFTDVSICPDGPWDIVVWSANGGPGIIPGTILPRR